MHHIYPSDNQPQSPSHGGPVNYYRTFILNLVMILILMTVAGYQLVVELSASIHGNPLTYALWVIIWVMSVGTGIEVIKAAWRYEREAWLAEVMPALFGEAV